MLCSVCSAPAKHKCPCGEHYCSKACQAADWRAHRRGPKHRAPKGGGVFFPEPNPTWPVAAVNKDVDVMFRGKAVPGGPWRLFAVHPDEGTYVLKSAASGQLVHGVKARELRFDDDVFDLIAGDEVLARDLNEKTHALDRADLDALALGAAPVDAKTGARMLQPQGAFVPGEHRLVSGGRDAHCFVRYPCGLVSDNYAVMLPHTVRGEGFPRKEYAEMGPVYRAFVDALVRDIGGAVSRMCADDARLCREQVLARLCCHYGMQFGRCFYYAAATKVLYPEATVYVGSMGVAYAGGVYWLHGSGADAPPALEAGCLPRDADTEFITNPRTGRKYKLSV